MVRGTPSTNAVQIVFECFQKYDRQVAEPVFLCPYW